MLPDAGQDVVDLKVGGLDGVPEPVHPAAYLGHLCLERLQLRALLSRYPIHLLVDEPHEVSDVGLGEDVLADLVDDQPLEPLRVQARRLAGSTAPLQEGLADVVGVLAALRLRGSERPAAPSTLDQAAEQVGAAGTPGVQLRGSLGLQGRRDLLEHLAGDDRGEGVLDTYGRQPVLGGDAPEQRSRVGLVGEHLVDGRLVPALAGRARDSLGVEGLADVEHAPVLQRQLEDAPDKAVGGGVQCQPRSRPGTVLDLHLAVAVRGAGSDPEPARSGLAESAHHLLRQVLAVELVDALDDRLHELAGGGVVGVLGDGDDADAAAAQHRLEGDGVLALAGEAGELPDEDLAEGGFGAPGGVQHPTELRTVGDAPALCFVDELAHDDVVVLLGVVAKRAELGGDGEVDVLAVAGDAGVKGGGGRVGSLVGHRSPFLCQWVALTW
ncbi:MAG: hypothetical protein OXH41_13185 [Chloroflexi bacterium]|nr:hypothetical protein [Chloroflexota bacterium]